MFHVGVKRVRVATGQYVVSQAVSMLSMYGPLGRYCELSELNLRWWFVIRMFVSRDIVVKG